MIGKPVAIAIVATFAAGCAANYRDDNWYVGDHFARLRAVGPDAILDLRCQLGSPFEPQAGPRMLADVGRCRVAADDDGLSRLDYPLGPPDPAGPPHAALSFTLSPPPEPGGQVDLIRPSDAPKPLSHPRDPFAAILEVPVFLARPFEALPDRLATTLAGPDPVAPALVELAGDLVDCPAVAVAGSFRDLGFFACRMSLTDAGRAKLRAALARRAASTRPAARP